MGTRDDARDKVRRTVQAQVGENAIRWDESFEEERVKFVLNRCGLADQKWPLLEAGRAKYGRPRLTFALFNELFPTFPVLLGASRLNGCKLHEDARASLPELFNNFERAPFFKAYEEFLEAVADSVNDRCVALVFPRNRIKGGLVIHDGGLPEGWDRGNVLTHTGGTRDKPFKVFVQPFNRMIESIYNGGHGWRPGR